jgi:hypothetical protein
MLRSRGEGERREERDARREINDQPFSDHHRRTRMMSYLTTNELVFLKSRWRASSFFRVVTTSIIRRIVGGGCR